MIAGEGLVGILLAVFAVLGIDGMFFLSGTLGLPAGVSAHWTATAGGRITITGTPTTAAGSPFNYSIPLTGGCGTVNATGTITVTPANTAGCHVPAAYCEAGAVDG